MKQCIREEMIYLIKSKILVAFILLSVLFSGIFLYSSYIEAKDVIEDYYLFKSDVEAGTSVVYENEDGVTAEINSEEELQYYKEAAERKLYSVSPQYTVEFTLESICSIAFFLFAIFAALWASYDNKNNTLRLKIVRHKRRDVLLAKHITMFIGLCIITIISTILVYLGNSLYYRHFLGSIRNGEGLSTDSYQQTSLFVYKMIAAIIVVLVAAEVGFAISLLIRKNIIAYFIIIAYSFFLPSLGKYDPRSCISAIMYKCYNYYGSISMQEPALESIKAAVIILAGIFILCYGISYLIYNNRSAYK